MYRYFTEEELACKCGCGESEMDFDFMDIIDEIRHQIGQVFVVTSGYRCPAYNKRISSTGSSGPHTTGKAIDIAANSRLKYEILKLSLQYPLCRFGISKNFIHIDGLTDDEGFAEDVIWTY